MDLEIIIRETYLNKGRRKSAYNGEARRVFLRHTTKKPRLAGHFLKENVVLRTLGARRGYNFFRCQNFISQM